MNFEVLRVQGARIGLKINFKKTSSFTLGIKEGERVVLGIGNIDQMGSLTYLDSIINEDGR